MGRRHLPLGRIFGIPIGLDYTWFLIFVLLTWSFAVSYYPREFSTGTPLVYWVTAAATAIMLFVSVLIHELGHSVVAMRYSIPISSITLFLFGGVAQMTEEPPSAVSEFWIALAGPATSLLLAGVFYLLTDVVAAAAPVLALVKYLAYINLVLVLFNLIPGFPLDGGRVFRAIVWGITKNLRKATMIAAGVGRFIAFLFIFFGFWQILSGDLGSGVWIAFIGWFLENAASAQVQQQMVQSLLAGHTVADAMTPDVMNIPPDVTLQELVDEHILISGKRAYVVKQGDHVAGLLTLQKVRETPRTDWATTRVEQVMILPEEMKQVRPDTELWECLRVMNRQGVNQLPVMDSGRIYGMLSRDDIISYLHSLRQMSP
jgi:Zn-dependent protease